MPKATLKRYLAVLLLAASCCSVAGCWSSNEPDNLAYVLAIGLDRGEQNRVRVTYLIANPAVISGQASSGEKSVVTTVEGPSFYATLNMANTYVGRRLTIIHSKLLLFSEEMARSGLVGNFAPAMGTWRELRGMMYMAVVAGKAADAIEAIKPLLETNPAKYIELVTDSGKHTGYVPPIQLVPDFYSTMSLDGIEPIAILLGPNRNQLEGAESQGQNSGSDGPDGQSAGSKTDFINAGAYVPWTLPRSGGVEYGGMGAAVFRSATMVGIMNGAEVRAWMVLRGKFVTGVLAIPDPLQPEASVVIDLTEGREPEIKVRLERGKPIISIHTTLEGDISGVQSTIDYMHPDKQPILEEAVRGFIEQSHLALIKKSQEEWRSDVFGFGLRARRLYLTQDQWKEAHWDKLYPEAKIAVTAEFHLRRSGQTIKIMPIMNPEKGVEEGDND